MISTVRCSFVRVGLSIVPMVLFAPSSHADWPQWRGPSRDGVARSSPPLIGNWSREGPPRLWESEVFPRNCGSGSVVVANGRAYVLVNWQENRPVRARRIDGKVLSRVQWFDTDDVAAGLLEALETARTSPERPSDRRERERWIDRWLEEHLPGDLHKKWYGRFRRRLRDGDAALSIAALRALTAVRDRTFEDDASLNRWLDDVGIQGEDRRQIVKSIATTERVALDVVLSVDMDTGATLWKAEVPGRPRANDGSSTPAVVGGQLFVCGTTALHGFDAQTGRTLWSTTLRRGGVPSSPVVVGEHVVLMAGHLQAYHRRDGHRVWEQETVRGTKSSPAVWTHDRETYILCNTDRRQVACVRPKDGRVIWTAPGGGISTPVVDGDRLVVHSGDKKLGLVAYGLTPGGAEQLWTHPLEGRGASSPSIYDKHVYLIGGNTALCVELATGKVAWKERASADISSPIVADGKLFALLSKGKALTAIAASPESYRVLSKSRVDAERCPSPAFADGRLVLRLKDRVACYDLRESR